MNIFLIGYMASGKTSIGKTLAEKMNFQFIDLDQYIEYKEAMSISKIFKTKGEIYFRKIETLYLKEIMKNNNKAIISLGGGTPCYGNNMQLLLNNKDTISLYLKASLNELVNRLSKEKHKRPLIAHLETDEALLEFIGKHLFERKEFYNQANKSILVDNKTIDDVIDEIIMSLF